MNRLRRLPLLAAVLLLTSNLRAAPAATAAPGLDSRVNVSVRQAPLSSFLDTISAQAKINFIIGEGLGDEKVTAFLHDVTVEDALAVLKEVKGIDYRRLGEGRTILVAAKDSPLLSQVTTIEGGKELDTRVSVRLKHAPLDQFISTLSAQTKINFVLADGLEKITVTAFLQNVTAREAIEIVLAVKGLTCRRLEEQKTYLFAPSRPAETR